tara:strand:- start:1022 stop:1333 length:312 start_codon:yes stop_codon:yes gene_type:complete
MKNRLQNISVELKNQKRYFRGIKYPNIPLSINDLYITTTAGDRLDLLANQFYKDVRLWWIIATANRDIVRKDSFGLKPGLEIRIPYNIQRILQDYKDLNNKSY